MTQLQPRVGADVYYYNPKIILGVGQTRGYGGREAGPYAAKVTNDIGNGVTLTVFFPSMSPMEFTAVPYEDDPHDTDKHYWTWRDSLEKARFTKAREEQAARVTAAEKAKREA